MKLNQNARGFDENDLCKQQRWHGFPTPIPRGIPKPFFLHDMAMNYLLQEEKMIVKSFSSILHIV